MDANNVQSQSNAKFKQALDHFNEELKKVRTGRAHPSMLDGIVVEAYGAEMPLIQVGSLSAPEPQLLQVTPFDPNNLEAISRAIRDNQSLGMNPMDDGRVVRVPIPPLNEERRQEYVKIVGSKLEECMISLRNVRHEAMETIDKAVKTKEFGEDDAGRLKKQIEDSMAGTKSEAETAAKAKEAEILTV